MADILLPRRGTGALSDYDFVRDLNRTDLAWEYLRRNPDYQRDWRLSLAGVVMPVTLKDGTHLYRPRRRFPQAEVWGLMSFR